MVLGESQFDEPVPASLSLTGPHPNLHQAGQVHPRRLPCARPDGVLQKLLALPGPLGSLVPRSMKSPSGNSEKCVPRTGSS